MSEPKIRFKEFNRSWEHNTLNNYLEENTERNKNEQYTKDDVLSVSGEKGIVNQIELQGRSFAGESVALYHIVYTGDIVYTKSPLKANPYGIVKCNFGITGIVSTLYAVYHCKPNVDGKFIELYFANDLRLNKYLKPLVNIGAKHDMKINNEKVISDYVDFPSIEEQQKIASFFSDLDEVIAQSEAEVKVLEKQKKGMMQKIFSQKVRFKKDDGGEYPEWEEDTLSNLGTFMKGAPLSKADISETGTPFILYGELYTTYSEVAYSIKRKTETNVDTKYYSHVGDVIIPTSGETPEEISTATCVMVDDVILAGDLNIYRTKIDGRIMSYLLNHQINTKIATIAQGKSIVHIQTKELEKLTVCYPINEEEQQKIADFLSSFDEAIDFAKQELEQWKLLKKGLLQQMFV